MKKKKYLHLLAIMMVAMLSCGIVSCDGDNKLKVAEMRAKIDSLEKVNATQQTDLSGLTLFIETLSDGLDSIAQQENTLFYTNKGKEKTIVDRRQLKKNLEMFQQTLSNQRQRIAQLTESLRQKGANVEKLNNLVKYLNQQLNEKDKMIKQMRADLNKKDVNITQLKERINTLAETNFDLTNEVDKREKELMEKDEIINTAYIRMGSKKELMNEGILSGGFLKKTKVNYHNISKEKFKEVDIRQFTEIKIPSNKPKILSQMPASSYELKKDGNGNTMLHIVDPMSFWSVSNYLIIQTN